MIRLYILMLSIGMSLCGCTNLKEGTMNDSFQNKSEVRADSCTNNKVEQESFGNIRKSEKKDYKKQDLFVFIGLFFLLFIVYHIIFVRKIEKRLSSLEKTVDDDKWKKYREIESLKEQKKSNLDCNDTGNISTKILDSMEQEPSVLIEEKAVIIEFPMENKNEVVNCLPREYKYLAPSYQGKFNKLLDEPSGKTRFRCWMEKDGWHFEFHGDLKTAIENYNATFDETCIVEGSYNGATQYKIEKSGTLDKDLRILTKSTIQLY